MLLMLLELRGGKRHNLQLLQGREQQERQFQQEWYSTGGQEEGEEREEREEWGEGD